MANNIKNVFAIIHPFWGLTEPKAMRKYSKKQSIEMMEKWKALVDRVKGDNNAVLYIEPVRNEESAELLKYAYSQMPRNRIIVNVEYGSLSKAKLIREQINNLRKMTNAKTKLFLCGERTEICVQDRGMKLAKEIKVKKPYLMTDLSVTWTGKEGKRTREMYALERSKLKKDSIDKIRIESSRLIPKFPDKLKISPKQRQKILDRFEMQSAHIKVPSTKRKQVVLDNARGFCTIPREKWQKKRRR